MKGIEDLDKGGKPVNRTNGWPYANPPYTRGHPDHNHGPDDLWCDHPMDICVLPKRKFIQPREERPYEVVCTECQ